MKKNVIFSTLIILATAALFMLRITHMPAHIAISFVGLTLLIIFSVFTRKSWKLPAIEILCRICYFIALATGIVLMNVNGVAALSGVHKVSAVQFAVLFVFLFIHKLVAKKK